jgi:hypothetical protein
MPWRHGTARSRSFVPHGIANVNSGWCESSNPTSFCTNGRCNHANRKDAGTVTGLEESADGHCSLVGLCCTSRPTTTDHAAPLWTCVRPRRCCEPISVHAMMCSIGLTLGRDG